MAPSHPPHECQEAMQVGAARHWGLGAGCSPSWSAFHLVSQAEPHSCLCCHRNVYIELYLQFLFLSLMRLLRKAALPLTGAIPHTGSPAAVGVGSWDRAPCQPGPALPSPRGQPHPAPRGGQECSKWAMLVFAQRFSI